MCLSTSRRLDQRRRLDHEIEDLDMTYGAMTRGELMDLGITLADWRLEYEELYFQFNPKRLPVMTLTSHAPPPGRYKQYRSSTRTVGVCHGAEHGRSRTERNITHVPVFSACKHPPTARATQGHADEVSRYEGRPGFLKRTPELACH